MKLLVDPMIWALNDKDSRVQLAACDSLYNIVKIAKEAILDNMNYFLQLFDEVINLLIDILVDVRECALLVD